MVAVVWPRWWREEIQADAGQRRRVPHHGAPGCYRRPSVTPCDHRGSPSLGSYGLHEHEQSLVNFSYKNPMAAVSVIAAHSLRSKERWYRK